MSKVKWIMEKVFVGFILSLLVSLNIFTFILGRQPSTYTLIAAITITVFMLSVIFAVLWRLSHGN